MPYKAHFESATGSLIIVGRGGRILEVNPRTEQVFGYSQDELVDQPLEILLPDRLHEVHRKHMNGYFAAPRSRPMGIGLNLVGRRKDGSEFPVEVSLAYAPESPRGDVVLATVVDITQRLALENEARRAETVNSLGMLAAGIAHDLNNPLQAIRSRAELLLESPGATLSDEMRQDLVVIRHQAWRASRIIEEFLELSRQREKTLAPVDINRLVDRALMLIGNPMREAGITIKAILDRNLPKVVGDATALERVLVNLLTNSRDAMPQGGTLTISSGALDDCPGCLQLTVADTGPGIHPDALGKVFDLLYTTKLGGTGLGLWLSRRIVREHNGRIDVQSKLGAGTTFTITLRTDACHGDLHCGS